jgi:hypothetical protein
MKPKGDLGNKRETKKRAPQKCRNCGELGHAARDCPEPRRVKATKNKTGCSDAESLDMINMQKQLECKDQPTIQLQVQLFKSISHLVFKASTC